MGLYRKTHAFISEPKWAKDGDLGVAGLRDAARPHRDDDLHGRLLSRKRRASRRWPART